LPLAARASHGMVLAGAVVALAASAVIGWKLRGAPTTPITGETALAVTTGAEHSTLAFDDATIDSGPDTKLAITRGDHRVVVAMTAGHVELAVAHRDDRVVLVRAGDTEIEDVGTRFAVDYAGAAAGGRVDVSVSDGEVKVTRGGRSVRVAAGASWSSAGEPVVAMAVEARSSPVPVPAPVPVPVPVPDHTVALRNHRAAVPAAPASHPVTANVTKAVSGAGTGAGSDTPHRVAIAADPYVDLKLAIKRQPLEFDPNIDGTGDATRAIAQLKKIAYSPTTLGADASQALYRIAVLLHKPLKQDVEALHTLDVYRRRFAGGSEMHAAAWLRIRIACEHVIDDECRTAAYSYQREVAVGPAADVAIRITNAQ
jgi:hypothetical protein